MTRLPDQLKFTLKPARLEQTNALVGAALRLEFRGWLLLLLRLVWLLLVALTLSVFLLTIQARYSQLVILGAENSIVLQQLGLPQTFFVGYVGALDTLVFVAYTGVGALIFARKSQEWIGLFASLALITAGVTIVRPSDALLFVDMPLRVPMLFEFALGAATITVFVYLFPDGRFAPRWLRWVTLVLCAFILYSSFLRLLLIQPLPWPPPRVSPLIILGLVGGALAQIYRYRRVSTPAQRQQSKWVVMGLAVATVGLICYLLLVPALAPAVMRPGSARVWFILVGVPLFFASLLMLPVTLAISILRYHLWDINLLLSRTLIFVPLTAILAGLFAVLENLSQELFIALTGQQSDFATVISTLIVVATFTPLKDLIKSIVEKRFGDTTAPEARIKAFGERVNARVTPLYRPQVVRRLLAEAVSAYNAKGGAAYLNNGAETTVLHTIGEWDGEAALCIPLATGDGVEPLGMIALDDRKNDDPYSEQDTRALTELAQLVARAIRDDQQVAHAVHH